MVRIIDENGRVFGLVNVIDLMVVLVLAAVLIAGFALVTGEEPGGSGEPRPVTFEFEASGIQPYVAEAIPAEGPVETESIRELEGKSISPAMVVVSDQNGDLHLREHPRLKTVELRVEVTPSERNGELRFGGRPLMVGSEVALEFDNVLVRGNITSIDQPG